MNGSRCIYRDAAREEAAAHLDTEMCRAARTSARAQPACAQIWWASREAAADALLPEFSERVAAVTLPPQLQ